MSDQTKPMLPGLPDWPSLYDRTGDIKDANHRIALLAELRAIQLATWKAAMENAAQQVPTNWLDPLLTGPRGIGQPPFSCPDIEKLLRGLAAAIRQAPEPGEAG